MGYDRDYYLAHREAKLAYQKAYAAAHRAEVAAYQRGYRDSHRAETDASKRRSRLKAQYDFTPEQYEEMKAAQGDRCAICGGHESEIEKRGLCLDHDHATGRVRGLLCHSCNVLLGHARDSVEILERAIAYLRAAAEEGAAMVGVSYDPS